MIISREQAICILYCVEFNEENAAKYSKKIEDTGDLDICYLLDINDPFLVTLTRINALPFKFHRYISTLKKSNSKMPCPSPSSICSRKKLVIRRQTTYIMKL
jgi:hypothetical protein